jgi:hypothetical protein
MFTRFAGYLLHQHGTVVTRNDRKYQRPASLNLLHTNAMQLGDG